MSQSVSSGVGSANVAAFNETLLPDVSKLKTESQDEQSQNFSSHLQSQEKANQPLQGQVGNSPIALNNSSAPVTSPALTSQASSSLASKIVPAPLTQAAANTNLSFNYYQQFQANLASSLSPASKTTIPQTNANTPQEELPSANPAASASAQQMPKLAPFFSTQLNASRLLTSQSNQKSTSEEEEPITENEEAASTEGEAPVAQKTPLLSTALQLTSLTLAANSALAARSASPGMAPKAKPPVTQGQTQQKAGSSNTASPTVTVPASNALVNLAAPGQATALMGKENEIQSQSDTETTPDLVTTTSSSAKQKKAGATASSSGTVTASAGTYSNTNWAAMNMSLSLHNSFTPVVPASSNSSSGTNVNQPSQEKMSPAQAAQGTFFHSSLTPNPAFETAAQQVEANNQIAAQFAATQTIHSQPVTLVPQNAAQLPATQHSITPATLGTARAIEKSVTMKAQSDVPSANLNISAPNSMNNSKTQVLSQNGEFHGVMRQVVQHIQNDPTVTTLSPQRVSVEIQTPPGAIVNVYISRQNDQFRAQLSTSDPQALKWVQDQVSALQQSPETRSVQWLPAQMESSSTESSWQQKQRQDQATPDEQQNPRQNTQQEPTDEDSNMTNKKQRGAK